MERERREREETRFLTVICFIFQQENNFCFVSNCVSHPNDTKIESVSLKYYGRWRWKFLFVYILDFGPKVFKRKKNSSI